MKLFFCQNDPLMGEPFWQNNSLVSHILFELQPIIIFSPVANFGNQSLLNVKSAVSLKWSVGFENDIKITPIFTINFSSKMLIRQCFTSLEHTFLDDVLNSLQDYGMYLNFEAN